MRRTTIAGTAAAAVCALAAPAALAAGMHPVLGARLSGMGDHGVVNVRSNVAKHWAENRPQGGARVSVALPAG
jgi:hypothetical protein